ncbi:MAG: cysteine desulfurase NifS [Phycisphaerae bacterium]
MRLIYLDNNATTALAPEVFDAMQPYLTELYGNPSSIHSFGQRAAQAIEQARQQVAELIGARPRQVVFTSGGTESDNLAIRGVLSARPDKRTIVTTAVEHPAVFQLCQQLQRDGYRVRWVGVDGLGRLDLDQFAEAIDDQTALVSVMWANNETGVIFPIEQVAAITSSRGVPLHVDAIQAVGKIPIDLANVPVDLLSISAHKLHGPKGVGALYLRRPTLIKPLLVGGHQELGQRPGTPNVAGIVGFGRACQLAAASLHLQQRVGLLRDRLEGQICQQISIASVNGDRANRLPNTTNISFEAIEAEAILLSLSERGVCASSGSACTSGSLEPSHVLEAMRLGPRRVHGAVRFSLSRYTTQDEIDETVRLLRPIVERLVRLMPA